MNNSNVPTHIKTIVTGMIKNDRLTQLKKYGFTEQNNIAEYQAKLKNNTLANTARNARTLANKTRTFRQLVDRCVGLA